MDRLNWAPRRKWCLLIGFCTNSAVTLRQSVFLWHISWKSWAALAPLPSQVCDHENNLQTVESTGKESTQCQYGVYQIFVFQSRFSDKIEIVHSEYVNSWYFSLKTLHVLPTSLRDFFSLCLLLISVSQIEELLSDKVKSYYQKHGIQFGRQKAKSVNTSWIKLYLPIKEKLPFLLNVGE